MFVIGKKEYYWLKSVKIYMLHCVPGSSYMCTWKFLKVFFNIWEIWVRLLAGYILTGDDWILKILVYIFLSSVSYLWQTAIFISPNSVSIPFYIMLLKSWVDLC